MLLYRALRAAATNKPPQFIGSSSATANGEGTIAAPAGIQVGDVLILTAVSGDNQSVTMPSGWTSLRISTTRDRTVVQTKVVTQSDIGASYAFDGKADQISVLLVAYRNCTVDTSIFASASSGTSLATGSLTTTADNSISLVIGTTENNGTANLTTVFGATPITNITGYSVVAQFIAPTNQTPGVGIVAKDIPAANTTLNPTVSFITSDAHTAGQIILKPVISGIPTGSVVNQLMATRVGSYSFETPSNPGYTITLQRPAATATGDLMMAYIANPGSSNFSTPTGWTAIYNGTSDGFGLWWKILQSSDPISWTWQWNGATDHTHTGSIVSYRNAVFGSAGSVGAPPGSVSTTTQNAIVTLFATDNIPNVTITPPATMSIIAQDNNGSGSSAVIADERFATATAGITRTPISGSYDEAILTVIATANQPTVVGSTTVEGLGSPVITKPAGVALGDTLVIVWSNRNAVTYTPPDASWKLAIADSAAQPGLAFYYKIADSNDVAATTYTFTSSQSNYHTGYFGVIRNGPNSGNHFAGAVTRSTSSTITAAAVTTTANSMLFGVFSHKASSTSFTTPAGYTAMATLVPSTGGQLHLAYRVVAPGTYAAATSSTSNSEVNAGVHVALY